LKKDLQISPISVSELTGSRRKQDFIYFY